VLSLLPLHDVFSSFLSLLNRGDAFAAFMMHRFRKLFLRTVFLVFLALGFTREVRDRRDRSTREDPVDFSGVTRRTWIPEKPIRTLEGNQIDGGRYQILRHLKDGGQGSVYLCHDAEGEKNEQVVVKTISAVARNSLPTDIAPVFANYTTSWPSEIDASLSIGVQAAGEHSPYVPVHDYFILRNVDAQPDHWAWALVTPFISGGTLPDLAAKVRSSSTQGFDKLDRKFRVPFERLLEDLVKMHEEGYCHDDVKPQNVFIQSPDHWLLGDLGNTRHLKHGWHDTQLWHRRNQWADCRTNDIRRAVKTYLTLLRTASKDRAVFDWQFLNGRKAWSKLYWDFVEHPTYDAISLSKTHRHGVGDDDQNFGGGTWLGNWKRKLIVDRELTCTSLWYKLWLTF
jgi:serine/threonine protein kinase